MKNMKLKNIIEMAIKKEEESYTFYKDLTNIITDTVVKDALLFLAGEEKKHKDFLIAYQNGKFTMSSLSMDEVIDYKIAQHLEKPDPITNMETKDVYLLAAHRELNSYNFYKDLAELQPQGDVRVMLMRMSAEELKHKEKVEYLYSNTAFPQTQGG